MDRRSILRGGLATGALLALPGRALAQSVTDQFDQVFGAVPMAKPPAEPVLPALPVVAQPNPLYDAKLREIAKRELERAGRTVWRQDLVGIADFARPSTLPRLHFVNLEKGEIRSFLVSHGRGSDPGHSGFLQSFSNGVGSEATSRGAYLTCEWYKGKYGTSIRLEGLDGDNSNALDRAIVMHPAVYAADDMISKFGKLGRSEGCFAMGPEHFNEALWHLSGGRLLYADRIMV
ncbi:murein L,D-transpeptidase catalytic domain-containing protein [Novosphingobium sp.]|uniref:murein L,D-transpeptidase catalytic domain-containing protein n=1 Tax=Novosphingobium sp. TaxID=1874826 RepID=UPI0025EEBFD0|nr:murein L,D-transpeptidase catalytic domain family protein [Novosphingobium sp.]